MKWSTIVFAVYVLGLSLLPCADDALPLAGQVLATLLTTTSANADTASEPEHEHHHDLCSPFCTCACCALAVTVTPLFTYSTVSLPDPSWLPTTRFQYTSTHWAEPLSAIWQPPKHTV